MICNTAGVSPAVKQMNKLNILKLSGVLLVAVLVASFWSAGAIHAYSGASSTAYGENDLTGAVRADLANISYSIDGVSAFSAGHAPVKTIDRMIVRSAFTILAAVSLMDAYDQQIFDETGIEVFTAVRGTGFTSANVEDFRNYFGGNGPDRYYQGGLLNASNGDETGSNETLDADAYTVTINHENFDAPGFDALNASSHENLNTQYQDLTDDLLETDEQSDDYNENGDRVVAGGYDNTESALTEVMKLRVSQLDASKPLPTQVTITNYTLSEAYLEQVMSQKLADDIITAYDSAKSAGFLSNFKIKSPLKLSRVSVGNPIDTFKKVGGNIRKAASKTFDSVRGSSAWTNALAFKDNIVKGTKSVITGVKEKIRTGFSKITGAINKIKTGTKKLISKAFGWFNGLSTKLQSVIKIIVIIVILGLVVYLIFNLKMITSKFNKKR